MKILNKLMKLKNLLFMSIKLIRYLDSNEVKLQQNLGKMKPENKKLVKNQFIFRLIRIGNGKINGKFKLMIILMSKDGNIQMIYLNIILQEKAK